MKEKIQKELIASQAKKQVVYEKNDTMIDVATGEILELRTEQKIKTTTEPDFIKIYYKAMLAVQGIEELSIDFVLALSSVITYSNDPNQPVFFYNNIANRNIIANYCINKKGQPISDNMVARHIITATKVGLLFKTDNRGIYEVNPCMIARGRWENIRGLQAKFDFVAGKWCRTITQDSDSQSQKEKDDEAS